MNRRTWMSFASILLLPLVGFAQQEDYPSRPIRIIVPLGVGSGGDTTARFFAEGLRTVLDQAVVVENMPGGNGVIAVSAVKRAPADGYTLLQGSTAVVSLNPVITKNLPYDPAVDFRPIHGLSKGMNIIVVDAQSKFRTLGDLIEEARRSPATLNVGTFSPQYQLAAAWLGSVANVKFNHVSYKGASTALNDLMSKSLDFAVVDLTSTRPLIASGKLRALAVSGDNRHPNYPNVPTVRESGFPEYSNYSWSSLYAPAGVPDAIINKIAQAMDIIMNRETTKTFFAKNGNEPLSLGPAALGKFQATERERFRQIAESAGIAPQ